MSTYGMNVTLENIRMITMMILDIFIIWLIIYYALRIIRTNTRTIQIFKGILFVIVIDGIAKLLGLKTLQYLADMFINWGFLAIIIIFQPEIRSILERMGKSNVFSRITTLTGNEKEKLVDDIVTAVMLLSKDQTGALISIEQSHSLEAFIQTGSRMNSDVTAELLTSIFVTSTPLHDGAVIIQGDKIACASAYFPPTNMELPSRFGARHRAAIGISEITDAVTIVVSEETGMVSVTEGGKIFHVDRKQLRDYLLRVICGEATEMQNSLPVSEVYSVPQEDEQQKTGMFSRLSIKKQPAPASGKIEAESVVTGSSRKISETENMRIIHEKADAEAQAAEIKLPHKKKRPVPSYPSRKARPTSIAVPQEPADKEETPVMEQPAVSETVQPVEETVAEPAVTENTETRTRMTPEEVQAAREASMNRFRHAKKPVQKEYDPDRLDVSRIVGFKNELDEQFDMVDRLPDRKKKPSENSEGGER